MAKPVSGRIGLLLVGIGFGLVPLLLLGWLIGFPFPRFIPRNGVVGVYGPIGISFRQSVRNVNQIGNLLSIEPQVTGKLSWAGDLLFFYPYLPLQSGQFYTLRLKPGAIYTNGQKVRIERSWSFRVREPLVLFLQPAASPELWRSDLAGNDLLQMTHTGGRVIDYAPQRSGERIAFSVANDQGGADLWQVDRYGKEESLLQACGKEMCSDPAWSPDGILLTYSRQPVINSDTTQADQSAQSSVWIYDFSMDDVHVFDAPPGSSISRSSWSPNGQRLAVYDKTAGAIRIRNISSAEDILLPAGDQELGSWSPDGAKLYYTSQYALDATYTQFGVFQVDFSTQVISSILENILTSEMDYSPPASSPDGNQMVVGVRYGNGPISKQLWLIDLVGGNKTEITTDQVSTHAAYVWHPLGDGLLFQRLKLDSSDAKPEVVFWDRKSGDFQVIAGNAARPDWLP